MHTLHDRFHPFIGTVSKLGAVTLRTVVKELEIESSAMLAPAMVETGILMLAAACPDQPPETWETLRTAMDGSFSVGPLVPESVRNQAEFGSLMTNSPLKGRQKLHSLVRTGSSSDSEIDSTGFPGLRIGLYGLRLHMPCSHGPVDAHASGLIHGDGLSRSSSR